MSAWSPDALVRGRASHLQFAADGAWEKALVCPRAADLAAWLKGKSPDVALEIFLKAPVGPARFVGVRLASLPSTERARVCVAAAAKFAAMQEQQAPEVLAWLRNLLRLPSLFRTAPAYCELGVVDAWKSNDPVRFWSPAFGASAMLAFDEMLVTEPRFTGSFANPLAIEVAFEAPLPHWLGFVVSTQVGAAYRLDAATAHLTLNRLIFWS